MTTYEEILASLSPAMREKVKRASEIKNEKLALPSIGLNMALDGGVRYGSQTMLWGNRSGGKTALALGAIANAQSEGKTCAIIEPEKSIDDAWLQRNRINSAELISSSVASVTDCTDLSIDLMNSGIDVLVIDSISTLLPGSFFDDGELKSAGNTNQIGQFSRDVGRMVSMFNYTNIKTAIFIISQIRTDLSGYHASLKPMGGKAVDHLNTTSIKLWSSNNDRDAIKADVSRGDRIYNKPVGRPVIWTLDKARGAGMGMTGSYDFYFDGDNIGVDSVGEVVDISILLGIIKKGGAWFQVYDQKIQGRPGVVDYVRTNKDIYDKLVLEIL